ncbi:hypothetical protein [Methylophaga sp.]|nr:hypothetical protein [Methylophaga sp.]|tara:strand:+ start:7651 stop:7791 length:141 start_codon:yes stop_codon:yes gene_type:complete
MSDAAKTLGIAAMAAIVFGMAWAAEKAREDGSYTVDLYFWELVVTK